MKIRRSFPLLHKTIFCEYLFEIPGQTLQMRNLYIYFYGELKGHENV